MPAFLVPLHEYNKCHEPAGSTAGGQFCATDVSGAAAQRIPAGQAADIHALAYAPQRFGPPRASPAPRLFLFDPVERQLVVGRADAEAEKTHAEVAHNLGLKPLEYDFHNVHGYLYAGTRGKLNEVVITRVVLGRDREEFEDSAGARWEQLKMLGEFADRAKAMGASADTRFRASGWGGWPGGTLGDAFPDVFGTRKKRARESNPCHEPAGAPTGGQFCSTRGSVPGLMHYPRPEGSEDLPDFLKADVLAAVRAGILVRHKRQPEPVEDVTGQLHDPLALSRAQRGEESYFSRGAPTEAHPYGPLRSHRAGRGWVQIVTRGGPFEAEEEVWSSSGYPAGRRKKRLTPEMLPDELKATAEDITSTFRHEVGHIMDDLTSSGQGKIGISLAREVRAWTYAVEISPDHKVSARMVRQGLESHAYHEFRKAALRQEDPYGSLKRMNSWDQEEALERMLNAEVKQGVVNLDARRKAVAFASRVLKSLDRYGAVLRKKGITRVPTAKDPWFPTPPPESLRHVKPGPGRSRVV